jgi:hypothetical protein
MTDLLPPSRQHPGGVKDLSYSTDLSPVLVPGPVRACCVDVVAQ